MAKKENGESNLERERESDLEREREIWSYLFYILAYSEKGGGLNRSEIAKRLSASLQEDDELKDPQQPIRELGSYIYRFISREKRTRPKKYQITLGKLVDYIANLNELWNEGDPRYLSVSVSDIPKYQLVTQEDILNLLQQFSQLSPEERKKLKLGDFEQEIILQQILLNLGSNHGLSNKEKILNLYKESLGLWQDEKSSNVEEKIDPKKVISNFAQSFLDYIPNGYNDKKDKIIKELSEKTQRVLERIKSQSGSDEEKIFNLQDKISGLEEQSFERYISRKFLETLTRTVIENDILNEAFPVYLKFFEIKPIKPLPLYTEDKFHRYYLLNQELEETNEKSLNYNNGLESGYAYHVIAYFYINLESLNYQPLFKEDFPKLIKESEKRLDFYVTSSGVGGQLSQLIKVINRALLWDIESFKDKYFPVAHDLILNQEIIQNNVTSPVWAHSLVSLRKLDSIKKALRDRETNSYHYEHYSYLDKIGRGDYCSFNFLEAVAKSSVQSRLRAIKNSSIIPLQYITNLANRTERIEQLRIGQNYLSFYPFSLTVMEKHLNSKLLNTEQDRTLGEAIKNPDSDKGNISEIHYDGQLAIIEGYLHEGLYRKACCLLKIIAGWEKGAISLEKQSKDIENLYGDIKSNRESNEITHLKSASLLAKFEIYKAEYFYLFDDQKEGKSPTHEYQYSESSDYPPNQYESRVGCLKFSWQCLERAETHLKIRLLQYRIIGEISQAIFHPYFLLLSKIYFLRAKIYLFYPKIIKENEVVPNRWRTYNSHYVTLLLFEKSRMYAACNGDYDLYSSYTACQSVAYLITGYLENNTKAKTSTPPSPKTIDFSLKTCLEWSKKLRDSSLLCYSETGRNCYHKIKEKSGLLNDEDDYAGCQVTPLPPIREINASENNETVGEHEGILYLDMSLLCPRTESGERIYFFGTNAAILLFARAMYHLCSNSLKEFSKEQINSPEDWKEKIKTAYKLFSYSWAIAEESKNDEQKEITKESEFRIDRDFKWKIDNEEFDEAASVRDLYPHRVTEIADLGKVYAIACSLILWGITDEGKDSWKNKINILKDLLHYPSSSRNPEQLKLPENQPRFNGHLQEYLKDVKEIFAEQSELTKEAEKLKDGNNADAKKIKDFRDKVVNKLFKLHEL